MSRNINLTILLIMVFMGTVLFFFTKKLTTPRELSREELLVNGFYELPQERAISNFELKTSDGILLNNEFLLNKWTLIYFGFTRCPNECPAVSYTHLTLPTILLV